MRDGKCHNFIFQPFLTLGGGPTFLLSRGDFIAFPFFSFFSQWSAKCTLPPPHPNSAPTHLPAQEMGQHTPRPAFPACVRGALKCCCRYPWVSPIKAAPSPRPLLFLADDWLMDEGWHFNEAISTGISIRWCAAYIFYPRLIARLCHSWKFIYTMFPEGPFFLSFFHPSFAHLPFFFPLPLTWLLFFLTVTSLPPPSPCHKIMLLLVCSVGAEE